MVSRSLKLYLINFSGQPATRKYNGVTLAILYLINFSGQPATLYGKF